MTQIPIFYAVDDNYAPALAVSIRSLVAHSDPDKDYRVIVLQEGLTQAHADGLRALATANVQVDLQPMGERIRDCFADKHNKLFESYFTLTIYYRLFIPEMFPQYDKGIYLDADTLLLQDVAGLYETNIDHDLLAAVPDPVMQMDPILGKYAEQAVGVPAQDYFNSGVLVMNLATMRQRGFADHFLDLLNTYQFKCIASDQDYLNAMAHDELVQLPPAWNMMVSQAQDGTALVHYNLFKKPWHYEDVPFAAEYWQVAGETPFKQELLAKRQAFTAADVAADQASLNKIHAYAQAIMQQDNTLGDVQRRAGGIRL